MKCMNIKKSKPNIMCRTVEKLILFITRMASAGVPCWFCCTKFLKKDLTPLENKAQRVSWTITGLGKMT